MSPDLKAMPAVAAIGHGGVAAIAIYSATMGATGDSE